MAMASDPQHRPVIGNRLHNQLLDLDPSETQEWLASLDGAVDHAGRNRAHYLMLSLLRRAGERQIGAQILASGIAVPWALEAQQLLRRDWVLHQLVDRGELDKAVLGRASGMYRLDDVSAAPSATSTGPSNDGRGRADRAAARR